MKIIFLIFTLFLTLTYANDNNSTFELTTINDQNISVNISENHINIEKSSNKVVFLLFFGHNCKPCLTEIPHLKKLMDKKYPDLTLLATDIHGYNKKDLTTFKEKYHINYPLLTREENKAFIQFIKVKSKWRGALPFLLVINKKGEVKLAHRGALNFKKFQAIYNAVKK